MKTAATYFNQDKMTILYDELMFAISQLNDKELSRTMGSIIINAGKDTIMPKKEIVRSIYLTSKEYIKKGKEHSLDLYTIFQNEGWRKALNRSMTELGTFSQALPKKVLDIYEKQKVNAKQFYKDFLLKPREEKIEILVKVIWFAIVVYMSGGGFDMEGGIPDSDFMFGIGSHRNVISHTILIGLMSEFFLRVVLDILKKLYEKLPAEHDAVWDKIHYYIESNKELTMSAMWVGIGAHLIKDSGLIIGGVKPYVGMPVSMPMEAHQGIFMANGIISFLFAKDKLKKT